MRLVHVALVGLGLAAGAAAALVEVPAGMTQAALQTAMVSMIKEEGKWSVLEWAPFVVFGLGGGEQVH